MKTSSNGFRAVLALVIVVLLAVGGYYLWGTHHAQTPPTESLATTTQATTQVSVLGMSQYTDQDFGFSFWYPSTWSVTAGKTFDPSYKGDTFMGALTISDGKTSVALGEFMSDSGLTYSAGNTTDRYYFDSNKRAWMTTVDGTGASPIDVSVRTMGGLAILENKIVALRSDAFVVVQSSGSSQLQSTLARTIVSTNPADATPVVPAEQTATVGAEQTAYTGQ